MGRWPFNTVQLRCDFCGHEMTFTTRRDTHDYDRLYYIELPEGWSVVEEKTPDCGLTGYTRTDRFDRCPDCTKAGKENPGDYPSA